VASADYASFVITRTRDVCFAGSQVKDQLSMNIHYLLHLRVRKQLIDDKKYLVLVELVRKSHQ